MEASSNFFTKILHILAGRYTTSYTLEELTSLLNPASNSSVPNTYRIYIDRENQARIIEALLLLNDQGHIFLNSQTEESCITIKGLLKINNTILLN
jgi:hypothetical protein